jgi:single-strand DNA-binding protein
MAGYNKVILLGNLTRDPELRYTPKGVAIAKIALAVNRSWRDATTGELKEEVTFVDIDAFGKQAETLGQYMKKGSPLFVEGRLRLDTWEDKQTNQKRSRLGVVLEGFQFLDSQRSREGGNPDPPRNRPAPAAAAAPAAEPAEPAEPQAEDDDVPF